MYLLAQSHNSLRLVVKGYLIVDILPDLSPQKDHSFYPFIVPYYSFWHYYHVAHYVFFMCLFVYYICPSDGVYAS